MAILVVEDENDLSDLLCYILRREGNEVIVAYDGEAALKLWRERDPDLVLLDLEIPKVSGWDVCQTISRESSTPVMIVSGKDSEDDMARGFDIGATDYVAKPFSPRLLQARIRNILRRTKDRRGPANTDRLAVGDLSIDSCWRVAACGEREVRLTRLEHGILQVLALHGAQVVSHADLIQRVWGYKGETSSHVVKGHIRSLRLKLEEIGSSTLIRVIPGVGYTMEQHCA